MNICTRVFVTLSLALLSGHAAAIPVLRKVTPTFNQAGNGVLNAGLVVEASTDLLVLVIAGGFTITCSTSSLQQVAQGRQTFSSVFGPHEVLRIPEVVPSTYPIPAWTTVPEGSCDAKCVMQWTAEAKDETTLSVRIGNAGVGANFTLIPQGLQSRGNSVLTNVCRVSRSQCCTPLCSIP